MLTNKDDRGKTCWHCGGQVHNRWTIQVDDKTHGLYCTKLCAYNDCWGPIFRDAKIVRVKLEAA